MARPAAASGPPCPGLDDLLVEVFPRNGRWYTVAYCFEGRNAHQTLGMLLTPPAWSGRGPGRSASSRPTT